MRIAGKARVCAGLRAHVGPEKAPRLSFAVKSGQSYPVAILVGPSWRTRTLSSINTAAGLDRNCCQVWKVLVRPMQVQKIFRSPSLIVTFVTASPD
jgi:hypothetical protein